MAAQTPKYVMKISENGDDVVTYSDNHKESFLEEAKRLFNRHMEHRSRGSMHSDIRNIQIHIYQEK